jgi:hypothetical protein
MYRPICWSNNLATRKIWLLKLVLPFRYGMLLTGVLLFVVLLPFFYLGVVEGSETSTPALFFSLIIAYIIPIFGFITAKSREGLLELRPLLQLDDHAFEQALTQLDSCSGGRMALMLFVGGLSGLIHMTLVRGSVSLMVAELFINMERFISMLGAMLVWIIMTIVVLTLFQQARLFARLGAQHLNISLLNTRKLVPFARVSIYSSLAILGAVALFPLIGIESGMNLMEILPGAIVTLGPLIAIFIIPIWPIHSRLVAMKEKEMSNINDKIEACSDAMVGSDSDVQILEQLTPLLTYRREITQVSTWPFDVGNVARLAIYMVIPPLTWVAAALIENLIDSIL